MRRISALSWILLALGSACSPTIRVTLDPITIHAQLEADVRVHLDEDVRRLIEDNPDLF